jgi:signal transduction histidine kinase
MRWKGPATHLPLVILGTVIGLLVVVAWLQYRWIDRLGQAERERLGASLDAAGARFCDDVDREVSRAWETFEVADPRAPGEMTTRLLARLARWRSSTPHPKLVQGLYIVRRLEGDELELGCLDESAGWFAACEWDAGLVSVRELFERRGRLPRVDETLPGLLIPVREPPSTDDPDWPRRSGERPPRQHLVVRFDRAYLERELLPRLAELHFGGSGPDAWSVTISREGEPGRPFFHAGPTLAGKGPATGDSVQRLFWVRPFPEINPANGGGESERRAAPPPSGGKRDRSGELSPGPDGEASAQPSDSLAGVRRSQGRWILVLRHPSGSLDAAVAAARRRNLAVSGAVLFLLAVAGAILIATTRKAQQLARQQMNFVAGISHELRTPLTAIRSAGQNLAAGIVTDAEQVRRYGALVENEGRRLTEMVSRVMAFAGIQSGEQVYHPRPLELGPILEEILVGFGPALADKGIRVEARIAPDLPKVSADPAALRHLFGNLIDNAMKYGASGGVIEVAAERIATSKGSAVSVRVSDRGSGIRRTDRHRVFDPFFRSAGASASTIPGSGLGLAVVRHIVETHGGTIRVDSAVGRGSVFTVELPALPDEKPNGGER